MVHFKVVCKALFSSSNSKSKPLCSFLPVEILSVFYPKVAYRLQQGCLMLAQDQIPFSSSGAWGSLADNLLFSIWLHPYISILHLGKLPIHAVMFFHVNLAKKKLLTTQRECLWKNHQDYREAIFTIHGLNYPWPLRMAAFVLASVHSLFTYISRVGYQQLSFLGLFVIMTLLWTLSFSTRRWGQFCFTSAERK